MTHYVCKLHAKYVNEFIVKLHCFIVLSWQGITNEVTAFQKCVVFSNFPFFSTVLLHKSEGCESKVKGCESISRYGMSLKRSKTTFEAAAVFGGHVVLFDKFL